MSEHLFNWILIRLAVSVSALIVFCSLLLLRRTHQHKAREPKSPDDAPHGIPIVGHTIPFLNNMAGYTMALKKQLNGKPLRLRLIVMDIVYLTDAEHITAVFRRSTELTNGPYRKFVSSTFGVPKSFQRFFAADNTGVSVNPIPGTNLKPEHRIDYLMHSFIVQFMTGSSLRSLADRFRMNMEVRLIEYLEQNTCERSDSLYEVVKNNMFHSSVAAMFGTYIFEINQEFCTQFWEFEKGVPELSKGLPRLVNWKEYKARDICLASVRKWQQALEELRQSDPGASIKTSMNDYDNIFGSAIVQKRHGAFAKIDAMDEDARASEDLALIWGSSANVTHATYWLLHSILSSTATEERFLAEIKIAEICKEGTNFVTYDLETLCKIPFLQSLYAETLRVYVANIVLRSPRNNDLEIDGWHLARGEIIAVMSYPMHQDASRFNTGTPEDPHPLSEFWPARFLVPGDSQFVEERPYDHTDQIFSLHNTKGSWLPYGGGTNECPGRFFAKQEMLITAALILGNFEVKLNGGGAEVDWRYYGSGVLGVQGHQFFTMRPRKAGAPR